MDEEEIRALKRQLIAEVEAKKQAQQVAFDPAMMGEGDAQTQAAEADDGSPATTDRAGADAQVEDPQSEDGAESPDSETETQRIQEELDALQVVFDDVRRQSRLSNLVTPDRWATQGMIPAHLTSQQFVDLVFEVLACDGKTPETHDAGETAGGNRNIQSAISAEGEAATTSIEANDEEPAAESISKNIAAESQGALKAILRGAASIPCTDIISMEGKETMYLYSDEVMTDTYARWAFLAAEDDRVATFVECVRQESKQYPRPMKYTALMNHPFDLTEDEVLDSWKATQETNLYPDIESCEASNGDVYFYSTEFLSPRYAKSLAEWESVERWMNP